MQRNQVMTQASVNDLKRGYVFAAAQDRFHCLCCGFKTEPGQIYRAADAYYDAEKFIRIHIETEHGSPLQILLQLDKRWTGLTELQTQLIGLFAGGSESSSQPCGPPSLLPYSLHLYCIPHAVKSKAQVRQRGDLKLNIKNIK